MDKRKGFAEVEDNFHPAFRFFFLENFPEPLAWYNSRLTFTRYNCSGSYSLQSTYSFVGVVLAHMYSTSPP